MKIAVCSQGDNLDAQVDSRFGRCAYFVIVDLDTDSVEATANPATTSGHGAGPEAAQILSDKGVEAVCANHVGPNAFAALTACEIAMYDADPSETVSEVVKKFRDGELELHKGIAGSSRRGRGNRYR